MTPHETATMEAGFGEVIGEVVKSRDVLATKEDLASLSGDLERLAAAVAPAVALAEKFTLAGEILIGTARVVKFGLGLGAAVMVIVGGFVAIGWIHP